MFDLEKQAREKDPPKYPVFHFCSKGTCLDRERSRQSPSPLLVLTRWATTYVQSITYKSVDAKLVARSFQHTSIVFLVESPSAELYVFDNTSVMICTLSTHH